MSEDREEAWWYDGVCYDIDHEGDMVRAMMDMDGHYNTYYYLFWDYLDDTGEWDVMSALMYMIDQHKTPREFFKECVEEIIAWIDDMPRDRQEDIYEMYGATKGYADDYDPDREESQYLTRENFKRA